MVKRNYWLREIERALEQRSVLWLSGVRRAGKTVLCRCIPDIEYFDCELPRTRRLIEPDPESFLGDLSGRTVVLDEIHRLSNPAEVLKIGADHFPATKIVATGSSSLGASAKFRDTLAGRKRELWLLPMTLSDLEAFARPDLKHRFLRGGLPPFFLAPDLPERDFQEWLDAYWAKDIQELFRLERRAAFQKFVELVMAQSGGIFEATAFARPCEVSRQTISNYLGVLEATFIAHVVRPFSSRRANEIVAAPRVYAFDTGFVCYHRGWDSLRPDDLGSLWEHFVLNEIVARTQDRRVHYWRDKRGHEIDFVLARRKAAPTAIECKWSSAEFDPAGLASFRKLYPAGDNYVVAADVSRSSTRTVGGLKVRVVGLAALLEAIIAARGSSRSVAGDD
jgi:predicted AAA+ superfamily ATPase